MLPDGKEFYRLEFDYCDRNRNNQIDSMEMKLCIDKQNQIIQKRVESITGKRYLVNFDLKNVSRKKQLKKGLNFKDFVTARVFLAETLARVMMRMHDNDPWDNDICPTEWWHIAQLEKIEHRILRL